MESFGVFHPGFQYSSPFIVRQLLRADFRALAKRDMEVSKYGPLLSRCDNPHCCGGNDMLPLWPFPQLQYSEKHFPFAKYPAIDVKSSISLPERYGTDIKDMKERQTKKKPHCKICNKTFARSSTLKVHLRIHSGDKPYTCSYCPKAFVQSANLVVHVRTHTGEKPYKCLICNRSFSQSSSVTTHMRIHTGERPFQCDQCGNRFSDRSTLSKHKRVHQNIKVPFVIKDQGQREVEAEIKKEGDIASFGVASG